MDGISTYFVCLKFNGDGRRVHAAAATTAAATTATTAATSAAATTAATSDATAAAAVGLQRVEKQNG